MGQKPRLRTIAGRETAALLVEVKKAKRRFGLPEQAPVVSCYDAGRDGLRNYFRTTPKDDNHP
jgi:hypothetical protein